MITTQGAFKRTIAAAGISFVAGPVIQAHASATRDAVNEQPRVRLIASQQSRPVRRHTPTAERAAVQEDLLNSSTESGGVEPFEQSNRGKAMIDLGRKAAAFALLGSVASGLTLPWVPAIDTLATQFIAVGATIAAGFATIHFAKSRHA